MTRYSLFQPVRYWIPWLFLMAFLASFPGVRAWASATQTAAGSAKSPQELENRMADAEFALYEEAEKAALDVRLQTYKDYMDQKADAPLKDNTTHMKTVKRIAELYGRLLMLRMETIVETKRRWPDQSVADQIDMLTYQPQLIIDIMLNIDWMVSLEGLSLSWDQKKAVLGNFHRRDVQRMERVHRADLKTIDIQATLSESVPDPAWMKASVDALVNQYIAIFDEHEQAYIDLWELLSPEQRSELLRLVFVAIRSPQ